MPCANASGTLKLTLLVIDKANKLRALKRCTNIPVDYIAKEKDGLQRTCSGSELKLNKK